MLSKCKGDARFGHVRKAPPTNARTLSSTPLIKRHLEPRAYKIATECTPTARGKIATRCTLTARGGVHTNRERCFALFWALPSARAIRFNNPSHLPPRFPLLSLTRARPYGPGVCLRCGGLIMISKFRSFSSKKNPYGITSKRETTFFCR
jgi:hypothetical protein